MQNLEKPDEEEVERVARETAAALALRVDKKQAAVNPKTLPNQPGAAQYIKVSEEGPAVLLSCRSCIHRQARDGWHISTAAQRARQWQASLQTAGPGIPCVLPCSTRLPMADRSTPLAPPVASSRCRTCRWTR